MDKEYMIIDIDDRCIHTHTTKYYSVIKKKKTLPFATIWMKLEGIMLNEVSQTETDKYCVISLICGI